MFAAFGANVAVTICLAAVAVLPATAAPFTEWAFGVAASFALVLRHG
jgi:hypothetical protein